MKKILAMLLVLSLLTISLAACSSKSGEQGEAPESTPTQTPAGTGEEPETSGGEASVIMRIGGTCVASDTNSEYLAMLKLAELVEEYSGGTIDAEVYPASQLGSTRELAESIMLGSIECSVIGLDVLAAYNPITYVTSLPYMFDNYDVVRDVLDGKNSVGQKIYASLLENNNIRVLAGMHRGYRAIGITKRAGGAAQGDIFTPADLAGLKIRVPDSKTISEVVESFGAFPVAVANAEIATSLSQGMIDGIDYGYTELYGQQWDGLTYVVESNHAATDVVAMVSETWFRTLTKEQQDAVLRAGTEASEYRYELMLSDTERGRQQLLDWGITPVYEDMMDMDAFRACAQDLYADWIGAYIDQEMFDEIVALNEEAK